MRRATKKRPTEVRKRVDPDKVSQVRQYKLITPLFGGGVETQTADPITIVRATEVRGQLRFWWRAARGGQYDGDLAKMKAAEEVIWGSAAGKDGAGKERPGPSEVIVVVARDEAHQGQLDYPFEVLPQYNNPARGSVRANKNSQAHPYAAFPLQPEQGTAQPGMKTKSVLVDAQFQLTLTYPKKHQGEVEAALWAWETFGGLGGRTRRGFGALQCIKAERSINGTTEKLSLLAVNREQVIKQFLQSMVEHVVEGVWHPDIPHLERQPHYYRFVFDDQPAKVWGKQMQALQDFRQNRRPGTEHNRPGRSFWPEPEAIRRLTGQRKPIHAPLTPEIDAFPRARFGLPIIFHFKDMNRHNPGDPNSDPGDSTLQGVGKLDRMASPLILRPLAYGDGRAIGLAALLKAPDVPPGGLRLKSGRDEYTVSSDVTDSADQIKPLRKQHSNPDVFQAFLDFLKSEE